MPKRRISVEGVKSSPDNFNVHVVVWEMRMTPNGQQETPIGERFVTFSADTRPEDMLPGIEQAAGEIETMAEKAKETREKLNELLAKEK